MFQNSGEVIMDVGLFLCSIFFILLILVQIARVIGRPFLSHKLGTVMLLCLIYGITIYMIGDSYRIRIASDVMLSYYEQHIKYNELTSKQKRNIMSAEISLPHYYKEGKDVSRYLTALKEYSYQEYISEGRTPEEAKEAIEYLMLEFK